MKNNDNKDNEDRALSDFVTFINSKSSTSRKKAGYGQSRPSFPNERLLEISSVALVVGLMPNVICSLIGYELTIYRETKKLSLDEMDGLYCFVKKQLESGALTYRPSGLDFTIKDGNSYSYVISWNQIKSEESGGHTMPYGLIAILEYCENLIKN